MNPAFFIAPFPPTNLNLFLSGPIGQAIDLGFVMASDAHPQTLNFSKWIVGKMTVSADGGHVGFISFADQANIDFKFNALSGSGYTQEAVEGLIDGVPKMPGSGRRLDLGLDAAYRTLFTTQGGVRNDAKKVRKNDIVKDLVSGYYFLSTTSF